MNPESSGRAATEGKPSTPGRVPCPTCGCAGEDHRRVRGVLRPCGTHAAFQRHLAHDEEPCAACVDAERTYQRTKRRRQRAAAKRRAGLLVDAVAVERACEGGPVRLTRQERIAAVRRLASEGATASVIADRLGMNTVRVRQITGDVA